MIDASEVTACLVTRGDVDLSEIIDSLPFERVIVYDNSRESDNGVFGRYIAVSRAESRACFIQDDDCVLAPDTFTALRAAYQPGHIVANMPERFREHYPDSCLVGFGAIIDRELPALAIARFGSYWYAYDGSGMPENFHRECDGIVTALTPRILVDEPYRDLPWASAPSRLWKQPEHVSERTRMLELARKVRDA